MKSKLKGIMMAIVVLMVYILPIGTQVAWGSTISYVSGKAIADGVLEKGDYFSAQLIFDIGANEFTDDTVQQVGIKGAASDDDAEVTTTILSSGQGEIKINKLKYNGSGKDVTIAIRHSSSEEIIDCSISLEKVEEFVTAGTAVKLSNTNTVNVKAGETQQIQLTLVNNAQLKSKPGEMKLSVKEKNTTSKNIKLSKTKYEIPELSPGQSKDYNITLSVDKEVTRGIHELEVDIDGVRYPLQLKVDSEFMPPSLEVNITGTENFKVNTPKDITIDLKNIGHIEAKNVKVEVVPNEKIYVLGGSNVKYIENIPTGKTQSVQLKLQINDPSATTVPLQLKFSYTDDLGEKKEDNQYIYLGTEGALLNKEVVISSIISPTGMKGPNENFVFKFTVSAQNGAKNVKLSVNGTEGIIPKSQNLFIIPEIKAGEKKQYIVTLAATAKAKSSTYPIEIKATYKLNNEEIVISQYGSVNISNPEADEEGEDTEGNKLKKGTPKVIVGTYKSEPVVVKAGEEFDLEIGFLNTNQTKSVHNLKANLTIKDEGEKENTGSVFTPVGASNTFYIADLAPGQTELKKIRLYTIPSASPKTYEITLDMEYEDDKGNEVKTTEKIGIPVEQMTKLEIADVKTEPLEVGRESTLTAVLYNTGKTNISNVRVQLEGEGFNVQDNMMFTGKFEQGDSMTYEPIITPNQGGSLKATIAVTYEDSTGQIQTIKQDVDLNVMEMPTMPEDMGEMEMPEPEKPSKWPVLLGVGIGIALAAIITALVMKKRRNKLVELEFDED